MTISRRLLLAATLPLTGCSAINIANGLTPAGGTTLQPGIAYAPGERGRYDLYTPAGAGPAAPLIVFFYGGGWQSGSRDDYGFVARPLASLGALVAVPDYRLFPQVRWPGFVEDGAAALQAILAGPGAGPGAGRPVILMGHSAGAFIALALALDPRWLGPARGRLAGAVGLAGPYDFGPEDDPKGIFAAAPHGRARAAPDDAGQLAGAPPLLLLQGEADDTVRPAQATRLAELARSRGIPVKSRLYPGVGHTGIIAALASPVRALGLQSAPVLEDVRQWLARQPPRQG